MAQIAINVVADLSPFMNVVRYAEKNQPQLIETAARRLLRYQQERFLRLSRGGGEWQKLSDITMRIKAAREYASDPNLILREKDELRHGLGMKLVGKTYFVGYVQNLEHWRYGGTVSLAKLHHFGVPRNNLPARRVIGRPSDHVKKQMTQDIKKKYQQIISRNKKKK
jgi:hypothetical protein